MKLPALLAAAALSLASSAGAVTIDAVGDAFAVSFDGRLETGVEPGLTAGATFLVTELDAAAGRVVLQIELTNTSDPELFFRTRVAAIAFDVDAGVESATASGLFSFALTHGRFPHGFGAVDVCAIGDARGCDGDAPGGLEIGEQGTLTLTLALDGPLAGPLELGNFGVRYLDVTRDPLDCGVSAVGTGAVVPEPRALALLGAAGLALFGTRRRARAA